MKKKSIWLLQLITSKRKKIRCCQETLKRMMDSRSRDVCRTLCGVARRTSGDHCQAPKNHMTRLGLTAVSKDLLRKLLHWWSAPIYLQQSWAHPAQGHDWNAVFSRLSCHFPPFPAKVHHKFLFFHRRIQPSVAVRLQELKSWCILVHQCEGLTITPQRLRRRSIHKCMTPLKRGYAGCGLI